jgi:hypothetical protein
LDPLEPAVAPIFIVGHHTPASARPYGFSCLHSTRALSCSARQGRSPGR